MEDRFIHLSDPRVYVVYWLSINGVTINAEGQLVEATRRSESELLDSMWLDYIAAYNSYRSEQMRLHPRERQYLERLSQRLLKKALLELIRNQSAFLQEKEGRWPVMTSIEQVGKFIAAHNIQNAKEDKCKLVMTHEIYSAYKDWAVANDIRPMSPTWLGRRLHVHGLLSVQLWADGKRAQAYYLNVDAQTPGKVIDRTIKLRFQ